MDERTYLPKPTRTGFFVGIVDPTDEACIDAITDAVMKTMREGADFDEDS